MPAPVEADSLLIRRIREGDTDAWYELIARFEGRLLAFVESRTRHRSAAEDLVQETFIGFLTSLPNFDGRRPLEGYLFSIAAHKLIDYLRREGRRPMLPLVPPAATRAVGSPPAAPGRPAASPAAASGTTWRKRRWPPRWPRRSTISAAAGNGNFSSAPNCCSCAAGRTRTRRPSRHRRANGGQLQVRVHRRALRTAVRSQRLPEAVFPELYQGAEVTDEDEEG